MGIVDEDIQRVRENSDLVALIGEHLPLKRSGAGRWKGLCPFHAEKTPSFSVNGELGYYYCFGCQAKGDAITFVREIDHVDFVGAVEYLAGKAGITLRYDEKSGGGESRRRKVGLTETLEAAVHWYHDRLLTADDAAPARSYLRSRGFNGDEVRTYRIGWAPDDWDVASKALGQKPEDLIEVGLAFRNRRNRLTDSFRGRILFPIFDPQGAPVGFGGRIMPGAEGPKYKNSAETPVYQKSKVLYALNWHKSDIVKASEVIVCEGYTDVIGFARAGVPRAVATCGTALTEDHVRLLKRFADRVVLAFDADAAGQAAAEKFYEWERAYEIDVVVAELPAGADPGELSQSDPERLRAAVEQAKPFLAFRLNRVLGQQTLDTPEHRVRAADRAAAVIVEHPDALVRDQYLMEVADQCRIEPERLRLRMSSGELPGPSAPVESHAPPLPASPLETDVLRVVIHHLDDATRPLLGESLFADPVHLSAYRALIGADGVAAALAAAEPESAELIQRLVVEEIDGEPVDIIVRHIDEMVTGGLQALELTARADADPIRYSRILVEVKNEQLRLREVTTAREAASHLLAWLDAIAEDIHED